MARLVDGEVCVEHTSCQPHVTHEVEQLVACRLIWVIGVGGIEHTVVYLEVVDVLVEDFAEAFELPGSRDPRRRGSTPAPIPGSPVPWSHRHRSNGTRR